MIGDATREALERELAYHEKLYSGFAQQHFAKPAVRAFRAHMVTRILNVAPVTRDSRVLSLGCGIGDTELLLASHVGEVVGEKGMRLEIAEGPQFAELLRSNTQTVRLLAGTRLVLGTKEMIPADQQLHFDAPENKP